MKKTLFEGKYRILAFLLIIGAILVNIKSIFTDFDVDSEYAIAMAYRMIKGDRMVAQMWEPHQTSAFLCAFFMKIYMAIFRTTTGVAIYLQAVGVIIKGFFTFALYKTLVRCVNPKAVFFMCVFFFSVAPKGLPMPEFSNMQIWFSVGLFCCLVRFFEEQEKWLWLLGAGVFLLLEVMAYPSCIIVYVGVVLLLFGYTKRRWLNTFIVTGTCLVLGIGFCVWMISYTGWQRFWHNFVYILAGDEYHSQPITQKFLEYIQELGIMLLGLGVLAILAIIIVEMITKILCIRQKQLTISKAELRYQIFFALVLGYVAISTVMTRARYDHVIIYIPIVLTALIMSKRQSEDRKRIVLTGMWISILGFLAALLLSNLALTASMNYLILAVCVAFLPIVEVMEEKTNTLGRKAEYALLWIFGIVIIFRCGFIFKPINEPIANILEIRGVVKEGPALGIVSNYMGPYVINVSINEWEQYVNDGDRLLIVAENAVSTLGYLYKDTEVAIDSTICTPTYDEKLLEYWEQNPQKYPNVVVVDCWFGELKVNENSWIMQWINNEFQADEVIDGQYYRYYIKKE